MSERVKILFAVPRMSVGGAEKLLVQQMRTLNRERFVPTLVTLFTEQEDSLAASVEIDRCFGFRSTLDIIRLPTLVAYLKRERFDVVVTHLFSANLLVRIAAILARVPVIVSYEHNIYPEKRRWQIFMDRFLARWTQVIITDSKAASRFTASQERIPLEKFRTMYIPPLLEGKPRDIRTVRSELGIPEKARVVLTVSRLVSDKGHTCLIEAAKSVLTKYPDAVFLLVGWGPLKDPLLSQARELGIARSIFLPGRLDIQDVLPLADVYVDPSVSTDLPIAIMEAMGEGKAIVATAVGDVPVFIENGKTGLCVPPRDPHKLAGAIDKLLSDRALAVRFGEAAKNRVEKYSLSEYMRVFEKLLLELYANRTKN
ncbi:glycosyltransferase [Candidatus Kaiserbacteria bacterium]|nr:glycosyltransferase [Candidatus Kaiserbacteria bacterium]